MQDIKNFLQGNFLGGRAVTDEKKEPIDLEEKSIDDVAEQAFVEDIFDGTTKENDEDVVDASKFVDVSTKAKLDRDGARWAKATEGMKDLHKDDPVRFDAETILTRNSGAKQVLRKKS
ncbi:hypothetical protein V6N13_072414 [Hibiscus sabdariffa]